MMVCMHVWVCIYIVYMYVYTCRYMGVHVCICVCRHVFMCIVYPWVFGCVLQRSGPVQWDLDLLRENRSCARYGPDTLAIRRPTHGIIRRFVLFVQWRPDGNSVLKSRHFMWVFVCWSILIPAFSLIIHANVYMISALFYSCLTLLYCDVLVLLKVHLEGGE